MIGSSIGGVGGGFGVKPLRPVQFGTRKKALEDDEVEFAIRTGPKAKGVRLDRLFAALGTMRRDFDLRPKVTVNGVDLEKAMEKATKAKWTEKLDKNLRILYGLMIGGMVADRKLSIFIHYKPTRAERSSKENFFDKFRQLGFTPKAVTELDNGLLQIRGKVDEFALQALARLRPVKALFYEERLPRPPEDQ